MPLIRTTITGIVQGVGFRPFIANLARRHGLHGTVSNKGPYVEIYAQGPASACEDFLRAIQQNPPARAIILTLRTEHLPDDAAHFHDFQIIESEHQQGPIYVSPDIATCDDCARELYDPENPRYLHPFINCTNCGPRLTIQESAPYDRCRTTMKTFPMCPSCAKEYHDPQNRRYDAQPVCCPHCGPHIYLLNPTAQKNSPTPADSVPAPLEPPYSAPADRAQSARFRPASERRTLSADSEQSERLRPSERPSSRSQASLREGGDSQKGSFSCKETQPTPETSDVNPSVHSPSTPAGRVSVDPVGSPRPTATTPPLRDPDSPSAPSAPALSPAITAARLALIHGRILALKGIGGFHLACDATNESAVARLRNRKHRPQKPFALMARDLQTIEQIAIIEEDAQRALLTGHQKPILLLKKKSPSPENGASPLRDKNRTDAAAAPCTRDNDRTEEAASLRDHDRTDAAAGRACKDSVKESSVESGGPSLPPPSPEPSFACPEPSFARLRVAPSVAPHTTKLGLLLPYTPLHMLLFHYPDGLDDQMPKLLVMTSGNPSGAPICHTDQEALESLSGIADLILTHNRPIRLRADDTVLDWHENHPYPIRRSRGFAPLPIYFPPLEPSCYSPADRAQSPRLRPSERNAPQADRERSNRFCSTAKRHATPADSEQSERFRPAPGNSVSPQRTASEASASAPPREPARAFGPASRAAGPSSGGRGLCDSERSGEHPSGAEKNNKAALKNITPESPSSPRSIAREDSPLSESAQSPRPTATTNQPPRPEPQSLSIGAELKNTFTLARGPLLYPSPYIGDTTDLRTVLALEDSAALLSRLLGIRPQLIACDLHPRYNTTALAEKLAEELHVPLLKIQHHHAHILSCLAEHGETGPALGLALDGTGYGPDGTIWGGELLLATPATYTRLATIDPFDQAGGDKAPREPWRIALALLRSTLPAPDLRIIATSLLHLCTPEEYAAQTFLLDHHLNTVTSTSCGRLFDAVSALLGLCTHATYEGEAPARLQAAAETWAAQHPDQAATINMPPPQEEPYPPFRIPTTPLFQTLARQRLASLTASPSGGGVGEDSALTGQLAYTFHAHLAALLADACDRARQQTGLSTVALSGGVFQNTLLLTLTEHHLQTRGFRTLIHREVPPNDGGLSLGQSLAAQWKLTHLNKK